MSRVSSSHTPPTQHNPMRGWNLVGLVGAAAVAWVTVQNFLIRANYDKGEQAYQAANCEAAIANFDRVINTWQLVDFDDYLARAQARKAECQAFQSAVNQQPAETPETTLVAYDDFVSRYPDGPLVQPMREQSTHLFNQVELAKLTQPVVCNRMDSLLKHQLIPQLDTYLPLMYHACGQLYAEGKDYTKAIGIFERFLDDYPEHQLVSEVKLTLAKSMVAEAKAKGAGDILPPGRSGFTNDGSTVVEIRNDSPTKMRLVFSGPEPRFEELEPCEDCEKFVGKGPETCPKKGPIGRYLIKPGEYDVVVKSITDRNVVPFTGTWALGGGTEYNSCFFIVQQPVPEAEQ